MARPRARARRAGAMRRAPSRPPWGLLTPAFSRAPLMLDQPMARRELELAHGAPCRTRVRETKGSPPARPAHLHWACLCAASDQRCCAWHVAGRGAHGDAERVYARGVSRAHGAMRRCGTACGLWRAPLVLMQGDQACCVFRMRGSGI